MEDPEIVIHSSVFGVRSWKTVSCKDSEISDEVILSVFVPHTDKNIFEEEIEMLWTRKRHERLRGLDQYGASADYVALFRTSNKHKEVYQ